MKTFWSTTLLPFLLLTTTSIAQDPIYDYIVVGSGPGGGTLAANLAKANQSVLLIEAGDDQGENLNEKIAGWFFLAGNDPTMRWDFFVKYHSNKAIHDQYEHMTWRTKEGLFYVGLDPPAGATQLGVYYPRAGTLGGCSTHNAMVAALPSNSDWQYIADLTGDKSWEPKNMRQYFTKLENDHAVPKGTVGHGFDGFLDITVNSPEFISAQPQALETFRQIASSMSQDPAQLLSLVTNATDLNSDDANRDQQVGLFGLPAHRTPSGIRSSSRTTVFNTWNATLPSGAKKYPLTLSLSSLATKILFDTSSEDKGNGHGKGNGKDGASPKAIGIEYLYGKSMYAADPRYNASNPGVLKRAYARKEVIISGGAFNTPQLLLLSGIGPSTDMATHKIPLIHHLPGVGSNLQDNLEMGITSLSSPTTPYTTLNAPPCSFGAPGDPCLEAWKAGKGEYTKGPLAALMYKTSAAKERDLFMFPLAAGVFQGYWPSSTVNVVDGGRQGMTGRAFDFSMVKMGSDNRLGTVKLASANPRDTPLMNFRFYEDAGADKDLASLIEGVEFGRSVFDALGKKNSSLAPFTELAPCQGGATGGKCDVKEYIKAQSWSHHATSSCAIGADGDPLAVLDSKFRVRGVRGLRVVDASAFPRVPGAFPVIPTFMLGMKASEVILEEGGKW